MSSCCKSEWDTALCILSNRMSTFMLCKLSIFLLKNSLSFLLSRLSLFLSVLSLFTMSLALNEPFEGSIILGGLDDGLCLIFLSKCTLLFLLPELGFNCFFRSSLRLFTSLKLSTIE
eukprot:UN30259